MKKFIFLLAISLIYINSFSQITISAARDSAIGTVVTVTGIVTNGSELGVIRYIQDSTAGVGIYPNSGSVEFTPNRGDEVTVTGTLSEYAGLIEIGSLTSVTINSTGNELPTPQLLTPSQISEDYEGELIKIELALFDDPGGTFAGNTNYTLSSNNESFVIRINSNTNIVGEVIPAAVNIVAIVSQFSWNSPTEGYQLLPRDMDDMEILNILGITSLPVQTNLTNSGFTLSWTTNDTSLTRLDYGLTEDLELGTIEGNDYVTEHSVTLTGLDAGTVYYAKAYSILEDDTASVAVKAYTTVSNSSGEMKVYFTQSVDTSVANGIYAVAAINTIEDTIISFINSAQNSLDIVIYDVESTAIVEAINSAYERGVAIRYISDSVPNEIFNPVLDTLLNPGIPLLNGNTAAIMHDKFIIKDLDNVDSCWVMTGSVNHTYANLGWDYNNMICIQDQSVAKAYLLEFNEMWGDDGMHPNRENSKFGSAKKDNTPHNFIVGGNSVELYFSPSDHTTSKIVSAIETANNDLEFAVMAYTENSLGSAVKEAHNSGVNAKGIIDYVEYSGSEFSTLLSNGVDVIDYQNADGTSWPNGPVFHHKYMTVDFNSPDSDPLVVTGSHNWTSSAESSNDENTLIIHNATIANLYHQEFSKRFQEQLTPVPFDDEAITVVNQNVDIAVLNNDFIHYQIENIAVSISSMPLHGTATITEDTITYTPDNGFVGYDTLSYMVCNSDYETYCDSAQCVIYVSQLGVTAVNDTVNLSMNILNTIDVIANDENPGQANLSLSIIESANNGIAEVSGNLINYTPVTGFFGTDVFTYRVCISSDSNYCDTAQVLINIEGVAPIAHLDTATVDMHQPKEVNVIANDENPGMYNLVLSIEKQPSHGIVSSSDSSITYTSVGTYWGLDTVKYRVSCETDTSFYAIGQFLVNILFVDNINILNSNSMVAVYPNPASNNITISKKMKSVNIDEIEILDISGKTISKKIFGSVGMSNTLNIDLSNYKKGIYLVKLKTGKEVDIQKFIIQ